MINWEIVLLIASGINIFVISLLIIKAKWNWAFALAFIQALAIGGFSFLK